MLNNINIMGRLVHTPELKTTPSGVNVVSFSIACDRSRAGQDGQRVTDFFDVTAWRGTADFVCKYFAKGSLIAITGSLQTRSYESRSGEKRKAFEIIASEVNFCGSKQESQSTAPAQQGDADDAAFIDKQSGMQAVQDDDLPF